MNGSLSPTGTFFGDLSSLESLPLLDSRFLLTEETDFLLKNITDVEEELLSKANTLPQQKRAQFIQHVREMTGDLRAKIKEMKCLKFPPDMLLKVASGGLDKIRSTSEHFIRESQIYELGKNETARKVNALMSKIDCLPGVDTFSSIELSQQSKFEDSFSDFMRSCPSPQSLPNQSITSKSNFNKTGVETTAQKLTTERRSTDCSIPGYLEVIQREYQKCLNRYDSNAENVTCLVEAPLQVMKEMTQKCSESEKGLDCTPYGYLSAVKQDISTEEQLEKIVGKIPLRKEKFKIGNASNKLTLLNTEVSWSAAGCAVGGAIGGTVGALACGRFGNAQVCGTIGAAVGCKGGAQVGSTAYKVYKIKEKIEKVRDVSEILTEHSRSCSASAVMEVPEATTKP